ncbi:sensor histidine kinase [Streptomyces sp. NPDC000348]|uniref:sensor histidine kinase n=1 Tax=Streptomyces sp. NPDC000348 TaxID=3364538 RepID=UPI0036A68BAB
MKLLSSCRANGLCQPGVSRLLTLLIAATLTVSVLVHSALRDRTHPATEVVLVPLLAGVLMALQVGVFITQRPGREGGPARRAALAVALQCLVVVVSAEVLDMEFCVLAGYLAGTLPLVLPARFAWPLFALVVVTGPLAATRADGSPTHLLHMGLGLLVTGLMAFTLSSTMLTMRRLRQHREDFARAAVQNEQSRFARDLHDLLGHTLSALTMRAELLHRTFQSRPELAAAQTDQLLRTARQSMAEIRMAVRGYRELPLFSEVRAAASLLDAVGIDVTLRVTALPSRGEVGTALAAVLRESVTNMLRHSDVTRCAVLLTDGPGSVRLEVINDGATRAGRRAPYEGGSGLGNLTQRLAALGGTLESRLAPNGTFRLVAVVPAATVSVPPGGTAHLQTAPTGLANAA